MTEYAQRIFLAYWSNEGLESIQDITGFHPDNSDVEDAIAVLEGQPKPEKAKQLDNILSQMRWRAQANPQRQYEAWIMPTDPDITLEVMQDMFDVNVQMAVEIFRERGVKLIDTRQPDRNVIS